MQSSSQMSQILSISPQSKHHFLTDCESIESSGLCYSYIVSIESFRFRYSFIVSYNFYIRFRFPLNQSTTFWLIVNQFKVQDCFRFQYSDMVSYEFYIHPNSKNTWFLLLLLLLCNRKTGLTHYHFCRGRTCPKVLLLQLKPSWDYFR